MYRWLATSIALLITSEALAFEFYECGFAYGANFDGCEEKGVIDQGCAKPEVYDDRDREYGAYLIIVDDDTIMVAETYWDLEKNQPKKGAYESGLYLKTDDYGYQKKGDPLDFLRLEKADNVLVFRLYSLRDNLESYAYTYSCTLER